MIKQITASYLNQHQYAKETSDKTFIVVEEILAAQN
jgi:hypothetical protein